jgi:transcriptional regulator with XRE-family HTH domain
LGLTQRELGVLFGFESDSMVCRYECATRKPDLEIAFACQVIFGLSPHEIFPGIYAPVEQIIIERIHQLSESLACADPSPRRARKLAELDTIIKRTSGAR